MLFNCSLVMPICMCVVDHIKSSSTFTYNLVIGIQALLSPRHYMSAKVSIHNFFLVLHLKVFCIYVIQALHITRDTRFEHILTGKFANCISKNEIFTKCDGKLEYLYHIWYHIFLYSININFYNLATINE